MKEYNKLFEEICEWQDKTFPSANAISKIHHLKEEVKELLNALKEFELIRYDDSIGIGEYNRKFSNIKNEFADCFLLLFGAANKNNFNLDDIYELIKDKFEIVKSRKWGKPDKNGVVKHIKS